MGNPQNPADFSSANNSAATTGNDAVDSVCVPCTAENWISIRYEYVDGMGVGGANYVVQSITDDRTPTGEILAEGQLDADGNADVELPEGHAVVEFYFHADPEEEPYEEPEVEKALQEPEPAWYEKAWRGAVAAADWTWGVLKGDFEEDPTTGQIITRMIITMIPGIDQLADGQDIVNLFYKLIWKGEYDNKGHWILLVITIIGLIPTAGSLAKGVLKLLLKKADDIAGLYRVFNYFHKGNAHKWLRTFATDLVGKHLTEVKRLLNEMLDRAVLEARKAKGYFSWGWKDRLLDDAIQKVTNFKSIAGPHLDAAAKELQQKLLTAISKTMTRIQRKATKNQKPHVVKQQKQAPPVSSKKWNSKQVAGRKVHQRDDLIDKNFVDPDTGMTNLERMQKGKAPIGPDGEEINLHHMTQDEPGVMAEVGSRFHKENDRVLHAYTNQYDKTWVDPNGVRRSYKSLPEKIDRNAFNKWKREYWKTRAKDF